MINHVVGWTPTHYPECMFAACQFFNHKSYNLPQHPPAAQTRKTPFSHHVHRDQTTFFSFFIADGFIVGISFTDIQQTTALVAAINHHDSLKKTPRTANYKTTMKNVTNSTIFLRLQYVFLYWISPHSSLTSNVRSAANLSFKPMSRHYQQTGKKI